MRNFFGRDCSLDLHANVLGYSRKQLHALAEKHWRVVDRKLINTG